MGGVLNQGGEDAPGNGGNWPMPARRVLLLSTLLVFLGSLLGCGGPGSSVPALRPVVPVRATWYNAVLGGKAVTLSNQSANRLTVDVTVKSKTGTIKKESGRLDIPPNGTTEMYWGFTFELGDEITVAHPDYRSYTLVIVEKDASSPPPKMGRTER
jgi:hypothetical protein